LLFVTGAILIAIAPASVARADPTCAEINAQLDQKWIELEPLIEQYNGVHEKYLNNLKSQAKLSKQLNPLQLQVDLAMSRVGAIATQLYKGGSASAINAVLSSGSPTQLSEQLATLDQLARVQRDQIAKTIAAQQKLSGDKTKLQASAQDLAAQDKQLGAQKNKIEAEQQAFIDLRLKACGVDPNGNSLRIGASCPAVTTGYAKGLIAAAYACNQIGKPYKWAAAGPSSFDCSGLTMKAWAAAGVSLAHYTVTQKQQTRRISRTDLQPGDLVFFFSDIHHMGLYVGNGLMVHAPRTGDFVRMQYIDNLPINSFGRPG
jgi:cell wall-associated NlpC family hydrolase